MNSKNSAKFGKPDILPFIMIALDILLILSFFELIVQIPALTNFFPFPSPSVYSTYPELGVKFQRLKEKSNVNCIFFGSSMVDADLTPKILEESLFQSKGFPLNCFNMGFSGSTVETSGVVATTLANWQPLNLVIFGLSPIDMNVNAVKTRPIAQMPVFEYYNGRPSFEGLMFNKFHLPWYFVALPQLRNDKFIAEQSSWDHTLDEDGVRRTEKIGEILKGEQEIDLKKFSINAVDMNVFQSTISRLKAQGIQVIVVEMPVHPDFFPYLVEGGASEYQKEFILPIQGFLDKNGIPFIQTQQVVENLMDDSDWYNRNHLNINGAEKFTAFIAQKISEEGYLR